MIHTGKLQPNKLIRKRISLEDSLEELTSMDSFKGLGITVINKFE